MKQLTVLVLFAMFGLGLVGTSLAQEPTGTGPAPTTAAAKPAEPAKPAVETGVMQNVRYLDPQLGVVGLLAVNSVLLVLGLGQLSGIKAALDKLASK